MGRKTKIQLLIQEEAVSGPCIISCGEIRETDFGLYSFIRKQTIQLQFNREGIGYMSIKKNQIHVRQGFAKLLVYKYFSQRRIHFLNTWLMFTWWTLEMSGRNDSDKKIKTVRSHQRPALKKLAWLTVCTEPSHFQVQQPSGSKQTKACLNLAGYPHRKVKTWTVLGPRDFFSIQQRCKNYLSN